MKTPNPYDLNGAIVLITKPAYVAPARLCFCGKDISDKFVLASTCSKEHAQIKVRYKGDLQKMKLALERESLKISGRKCPVCDNPLIGKTAKARCCSDKCASIYNNYKGDVESMKKAAERHLNRKRNCIVCKKDISKINILRKACSPSCQAIAVQCDYDESKIKIYVERKKIRNCIYCNKDISDRRSDANVCGEKKCLSIHSVNLRRKREAKK